jgi:hypothetical protein
VQTLEHQGYEDGNSPVHHRRWRSGSAARQQAPLSVWLSADVYCRAFILTHKKLEDTIMGTLLFIIAVGAVVLLLVNKRR